MRCINTAAFLVSVNGELESFFGSRRGIRQGCSLSPYLYVIISNVLSKLLNKAAANDLIGYHPQCQEVNLSHLSFADDIIVFINGSPASLRHVLLVFEEFASLSGLQINIAKSTVFAASIDKQLLETEATTMGRSISNLPIKYLVLPLTSKIMSKEPLVSKIRKQLLSWTSKTLSYAGRIQLIISVIASMTNFWCAAFCLPQACIDELSACALHFYGVGRHMIHPKQKLLGRMYVTLMRKEAWVSDELEK